MFVPKNSMRFRNSELGLNLAKGRLSESNVTSELVDVVPVKKGRYKTVLSCKYGGIAVIAIIFSRDSPNLNLGYMRELQDKLSGLPNVLPYSHVIDLEGYIFVMRQVFQHVLEERMSERPFLEDFEKMWIVYQILSGLEAIHEEGISHGDLKCSNILLTASNMVLIADFFPHKNVYMDNDIASMSLIFNTSQRNSCKIAPERFIAPQNDYTSNSAGPTPEMDIFSMGCIIYELFLDGAPLFTISQLISYKSNQYNPSDDISSLSSRFVQLTVNSMISIDPLIRRRAFEYKTDWGSHTLPENSIEIVREYISNATEFNINRSSTRKNQDIFSVRSNLGTIFERVTGLKYVIPDVSQELAKVPLAESDRKVFLLLLTHILSVIDDVQDSSEKICALKLLLDISLLIEDNIILDRTLPYAVSFMCSEDHVLCSMSLIIVTKLTNLVREVDYDNMNIIVDWIFRETNKLILSKDVFIRSTCARFIPQLGKAAVRFFNIMDIQRNNPNFSMKYIKDRYPTYDENLYRFLDVFYTQILTLINDASPVVKRETIAQMSDICALIESSKIETLILPHITTYFNESDWRLSLELYNSLKYLSTCLHQKKIEEYILLLIMRTPLINGELVVSRKVLEVLSFFAEKKILSDNRLRDVFSFLLPLLCCPEELIIKDVARFIELYARGTSKQEVVCDIIPQLDKYLTKNILFPEVKTLLVSLDKPIDKSVLKEVIASKSDKDTLKDTRNEKALLLEKYLCLDNSKLDYAQCQNETFEYSSVKYSPIKELPVSVPLRQKSAKDSILELIPVQSFKIHEEKINQVRIDYRGDLISTCSNDNTVRLFNIAHLKEDLFLPRAQIYEGHKYPVKFVEFIKQSYVASASSSLHINPIERFSPEHNICKSSFGKITLLKAGSSNSNHTLWFCTSRNSVNCFSLKSLDIVYKFNVSPRDGLITSICTGKEDQIIIIGTSKGKVSVVDTRFGVGLKSWVYPKECAVTQLGVISSDREIGVISSSNLSGEISVWDIELGKRKGIWYTCRENFDISALDPNNEILSCDSKGNMPLKFDIMNSRDNFPLIVTTRGGSTDTSILNLERTSDSRLLCQDRAHSASYCLFQIGDITHTAEILTDYSGGCRSRCAKRGYMTDIAAKGFPTPLTITSDSFGQVHIRR